MRLFFGILIFLITLTSGFSKTTDNSIAEDSIVYLTKFEASVFEDLRHGIDDPLNMLLATDGRLGVREMFGYKKSFREHVDAMKTKRDGFQKEVSYLRFVFHKTRYKYLKNYQRFVTFAETFRSGTYDCVTGTALYASLLDNLGYEYEIIETPRHVFLLINGEEKKYLVESTLKDGFVTSKWLIKKAMKKYESQKAGQSVGEVGDRRHVHGSGTLGTIGLKQLAGLQYYNNALLSLSASNTEMALNQLRKSELLYPSERMAELRSMIEKLHISK
ncbi:hypothetical protein FUAX_03000 [Fulvitalea axinellae]|uniref:Transglutaminase-like domain-containing protein n=1 Tax=Fulvitalea axinellae TaxID=1182444 RepID=A0AAU9CWB6_9BACT|nr:hypothetical protein FUAX_03000 [Fulvitalea axinellae]